MSLPNLSELDPPKDRILHPDLSRSRAIYIRVSTGPRFRGFGGPYYHDVSVQFKTPPNGWPVIHNNVSDAIKDVMNKLYFQYGSGYEDFEATSASVLIRNNNPMFNLDEVAASDKLGDKPDPARAFCQNLIAALIEKNVVAAWSPLPSPPPPPPPPPPPLDFTGL